MYQVLTFDVYTNPFILRSTNLLKASSASFFTSIVDECGFLGGPSELSKGSSRRRMYVTEFSMPRRVECPDGSVFGPVSRKRFGNPDTITLLPR